MKHLLIFLFLFITLVGESFSQRWTRERHHLYLGLGGSGFMGELGGADQVGTQGMRDFDFAAVKPAGALGYRYMLMENLGLKANLTFGYVSGDDKNTDEAFRNNRNIHFRSPILELSPQLQFTFYSMQKQGARYTRLTGVRGRGDINISAHFFAGIAAFYFNPQGYFEPGNYNGSIEPEFLPSAGWYNLRPLRTEGQGFFPTRRKYLPVAFSIPFGIGAIVQLNRDISIGIEYGFRKTFTDYIDDVSTTYVDPAIFSEMFTDPAKIALAEYFANPTLNNLSENVTSPGQQRGNPYNADAYMFSFITVYYRLPQVRRPYGVPRF